MAIIGLSLGQETYFVSEFDDAKGTENETKFLLGTLDARTVGKLKDAATRFTMNPENPEGDVDVRVGQNELYFLACRYGLRGWAHFMDREGNEVKFAMHKVNFAGRSYRVATDECLNMLPQEVIAEIGRKLLDTNDVSEEEEKN